LVLRFPFSAAHFHQSASYSCPHPVVCLALFLLGIITAASSTTCVAKCVPMVAVERLELCLVWCCISLQCGAFPSSESVASHLFSGHHLFRMSASYSMSSSSEVLERKLSPRIPSAAALNRLLPYDLHAPARSSSPSSDHRLSSASSAGAPLSTPWDTSTWDLLCWRLLF